ncbi:hypothetical protein Q4S45_04575 [Massilia sp. R2A-15]|uniref:hypothetical protein n=1 Tax=Massilia sp. R2A-15 TaxID=3064278 RepID=UPI0027341180|nr:hypothetical protein [Massilia sp. R2A-15]WLI90402.1 hypothetical protein Q4S45_04575 [Massilia sp. R2A-15]
MPTYTNYAGELSTELDAYRKRGEKEAAHHRPPGDALQMDQNETTLQAEAEKWIGSEQRLFDAVLTESSRAIAESGQKVVELQGRADQLLLDTTLLATIEADMSAERDALVLLTENRMKTEVDWRHLRAINGITIQASYPESVIWHLALIFALALIETIVNAFFYENSQGLLGGFTVALGVSFINMVGALILGYGFRYKNLSKIDYRFVGYGCLIAFLVLAIYCNALFAAFRSEYQLILDPSDGIQMRHGFAIAAAEAKKIFYLGMGFSDLTSFVLFGLGLVLSFLAFYKGYTLDDKFPGYGALDRTRKEALKSEAVQQEMLRQKIKEYLHHRKAETQAILHEPAQIINLASRRISDLQIAKSTLINQAQAIQRDFALVLSTYRNANASIRATAVPGYFKIIPDLIAKIDVSPATPFLDQLARLQTDVKIWRDENQDALNLKLQALQSDSAKILSFTFSAFLRDVENEAKERINRAVATVHRDNLEMTTNA